MRLDFKPQAMEDLLWWIQTDRRMAAKIVKLVMECRQTPFAGTGKPEPLRYQYSRCWSRRIDQEHRLVYQVEDGVLVILSCRFHYT